MRRSDFIKHLSLLTEEELQEEMKTLFSKVKEVRTYYSLELGSDEDRRKIYETAKKEIAAKYVTKSYRRPRRPRIQKVNAILSKLKKEAIFPFEVIDIYLFNVEAAINFMHKYYYDSRPLRNTITTSFAKAIELIVLEKMEDQYKDRCENILNSKGVFIELRYELTKVYNKFNRPKL